MPVPGKMLLHTLTAVKGGKRQDYITRALQFKMTMDSNKKKPRVNSGPSGYLYHCALTIQLLFDAYHPLAQVSLALNVSGDLIYGVHHGRMIAPTKNRADLRQRRICLFS